MNIKLNKSIHTIIHLRNIKLFSILLFLAFSTVSYSGLYGRQILSEKIDEADLIVKGKLIEKYSKRENIIDFYTKAGISHEIPSSVYTTFVFSIQDVLKGNLKKNTVDVKMLGGCDGDDCESWSIGYDYKISETGVLFLKYDELNKIYRSSQNSSTAFVITEKGYLISKALYTDDEAINESRKTNFLERDENGKMKYIDKLSLQKLKQEIQKVQ